MNWDIEKQEIDKAAIAKADFIIHLAGAGVADRRWTKKRKQEIVNSRVKGGELLAKALEEYPNHVKAVITASAIGWYGPDPVIPNPHPFNEIDPSSNDFLGSTCRLWEQSLEPVKASGIRLVKIRTGIVLSKKRRCTWRIQEATTLWHRYHIGKWETGHELDTLGRPGAGLHHCD